MVRATFLLEHLLRRIIFEVSISNDSGNREEESGALNATYAIRACAVSYFYAMPFVSTND